MQGKDQRALLSALSRSSPPCSRLTDPNGPMADKRSNGNEPHQYQAGSSTDREQDQWKHRAPYRIHESDDNFSVKWKGKCHCGAVQYQLSRDKPLASKYCHCTTCQRMHGVSLSLLRITPRPRWMMGLTGFDRRRSSGPPYSTKKTSTSLAATTTSAGMTQQPSRRPIISHAKCSAPTVARPSWTRGAT